ncbi:MAG: flagellar basal body L-ring protein FlgH [Nannocystaceae bacterium]|nr:flagellar basal body L-ring protein FlgH [Nannocystaceae bacterium]
MRTSLWLALGIGLAVSLMGCAGPVVHYKFPTRNYKPGHYASDAAGDSGLLWGEHTANVLEDARSRRLGDLVIVRIEESADAVNNASTKTKRKSSVEGGINNFLGMMERYAKKHPNVDAAALVKAMFESSFEGDGETKRTGTVTAMIPCQVKQVLPNGDLFIEGTKSIQINAEETHLYLSGVVRPFDIDMANTVASARILDARIDFSGRGVVSDKQRPGLLHRALDHAFPF